MKELYISPDVEIVKFVALEQLAWQEGDFEGDMSIGEWGETIEGL
jgi:hypothetical protein